MHEMDCGDYRDFPFVGVESESSFGLRSGNNRRFTDKHIGHSWSL